MHKKSSNINLVTRQSSKIHLSQDKLAPIVKKEDCHSSKVKLPVMVRSLGRDPIKNSYQVRLLPNNTLMEILTSMITKIIGKTDLVR